MIGELRREPLEPETANASAVKLSFTELRRLTDLLDERTGLRFGPKRFGAVRTCVMKRMQALGIAGFEEYLAHALHPDHSDELRQVSDLMIADGG